jgi:hypothetical protein
MIEVFHFLPRDLTQDRFNAFPRTPNDVRRIWGHKDEEWTYRHVASVDTDDLDVAWDRTNHIDDSWQKNADVIVAPMGERARSSMVGDVFIRDGVAHCVAPFGFEQL